MKDALKKDHAGERREEQQMRELAELESETTDPARRTTSLADLKGRLAALSHKAEAPQDSDDRRMARHVVRSAMMGAIERGQDPEYWKLLEKFGAATRPWQ